MERYRSMIIIPFIKKILTGLVLSSISLLGFSQNNNPIVNYNHFVTFLNEHYGLFPYKNINWDSLTEYYSTLINDGTSPDSLFFILCRLAGNLRDKHLWIDNDKFAYNYSLGYVAFTSRMDSIFASRRKYKNVELIKSRYLNNTYNTCRINNFLYGKIGNNTGYISFDWFDKNVRLVDSVMTGIINALADCSFLIVDIRNNIGGTDSSALTLANHIVKTNKCYQIARIRGPSDGKYYSAPVSWHTHAVNKNFNKHVIVLVNRYTISAAEAFLLALKNQKHIRFLGEPTAGAFSDAEDAYLPNGWHFTYSIGVWTDSRGILWEGIGIQPDIYVKEPEEQNDNNDLYMELALRSLAQ